MKISKKLFVVFSMCVDSSREQNAIMQKGILVVSEEFFIRVEDNVFLHEKVWSRNSC